MLPFESVRDQLLKAGIAAGHVNRYVVELREHLSDLTARERSNGAEPKDAALKARTIMGTDTQLVQAMLERNPPRALAVKAPWAVFGVLPAVALVATAWITAMIMMKLLWPVRAAIPADMSGGYQALVAVATVFTGYLVGPLLAATCITIALRQRLTSAWVWAGLAVIALFSGFFGFQAPGAAGETYRATMIVQHGSRQIDGAATLSLIAVRAVVLFVLAVCRQNNWDC